MAIKVEVLEKLAKRVSRLSERLVKEVTKDWGEPSEKQIHVLEYGVIFVVGIGAAKYCKHEDYLGSEIIAASIAFTSEVSIPFSGMGSLRVDLSLIKRWGDVFLDSSADGWEKIDDYFRFFPAEPSDRPFFRDWLRDTFGELLSVEMKHIAKYFGT